MRLFDKGISSKRQPQASGVPFEGLGLVESLSWNRILDLPEIDGGRFIHFVTEALAKRRSVVRIDLGILGRPRDGDVSKAPANEFGVDVGVHIHEDAFCGETLRAVRGHGVTVIEVPHLPGIERHGSVFTSIHANGDDSIVADLLKGAEVTVGKLTFNLAVPADAAQPFLVFFLYGQQMFSLGSVTMTWAYLPALMLNSLLPRM
jgi:hypothetical protein